MTKMIRLAMLSCLAFGPARAEAICQAPMANWQPVALLVAEAARLGWAVVKVRADDGCYRVHATDAQGRNVEAVFDPETLNLLGQSAQDPEGNGDQDGAANSGSN